MDNAGNTTNNSNSNGGGGGLSKLLAKRRRRARTGGLESDASGRDDDAVSINIGDDDDIDDRSFGSYESGGADADGESERSISRPPLSRATTTSVLGSTSTPALHVTDFDPRERRPSLLSRRLRRGTSRSPSPSPNASKEAVSEIAPLPELPAAARITASPEKHSIHSPSRLTTLPRPSTSSDRYGPVIVNTPPTPVERTIPAAHLDRKLPPVISEPSAPGDGASPSSSSPKAVNVHRRSQSGSAAASIVPSKLSNITLAPLSPTPENGQSQPPNSAGFFSSMFSVAQNAASTITGNIQGGGIGIGGNKSRTNLPAKPQSSSAEVDGAETPLPEPQSSDGMDKKETTTKTIGTGDLSLSQLGIMEPSATTATNIETSRFPDLNDTRARSESAPADTSTRGGDESVDDPNARPRSLNEAANGEQEQGASQSDQADGKDELKSDAQRKRGSSTATTHTVAPPAPAGPAPKLTGFAIASKKRNRDFHTFFKSVPDDDYLIEDYSCALQREILAHGRLYVSEGHLCFSSNILGWTTTLVMSFDEIVSVEKRSTALAAEAGTLAGGDGGSKPTRKVSGAVPPSAAPADGAAEGQAPAGGFGSFPGPATHAPTDCGDTDTHYDKFLADEVVPAPLGKVFSMLFGEASAEWMGKWITENQKCFDLQLEDKKGLGPDNRSRGFTYIKPLNAPIGPKQTKCIVTETVDNIDFEKAVTVSVATQNPDVPSGNIFRVKTKYCLSWAENNATRVQVNCTTEWSGKSWLKGTIEKNVNEGQAQYCKDLFAALKAAVSSRPRSSTNNGVKTKKKGKRSKALQSSTESISTTTREKKEEANWGLLEPVRAILEPIVDILKPLLTGNIVYGLLVGLLVATWFGFGFGPNSKSPASYGPDPALQRAYRLAAYDEMWRREDSELWAWLEERVSLERLAVERSNARRREADPRTLQDKLREERMDEREVEEAIRVTEEKLKVLREVVARGKIL
ncbi:hypothetical protein M440DRAFT_1436211 [Trichoderma longibrachiatum ATCC 18648]|uniref:VASt domain-containing protein n=1 Tax=Trichoderma longibrachiatum ATCC 18648 TaxID=983965 RepID=A0A2T4CGK7_TRILO|nr:hypothetical protein M440DRAFT_1436211 [Trichoderma longibrachiatum ATCC 18648]